MSMNGPIDWQASMEATELAATAASRRTERVVFGLAQIIEDQRHHLALSKEIKKELQKMAVHMKEIEKPPQVETLVASPPRSFKWRTVAATLVAGILLGVSIVN